MRTLILAAAVALLAPGAVSAQSEGSASPDTTRVFEVDPLVVTATRGPRAVSRTPRPVSVVQRRDIVQQVPNTVSDLFRGLPGLDVTGVGINQGRPQIRGQRGQRILLLADGLRLNNSRRQQDFGELPALVDVNGVERVEIVRGPGSVLYGSDAIGGVVNVISRVPRADGLHGSASVRYGEVENQRALSARVYGRFDALTVRAGGTVRDADAYQAPSGSFGDITLTDDVTVFGSGAEDRSFDLRLGLEPADGRHAVFGHVERYESDDAGFGRVDPAAYDPEGTPVDIRYPFQDFTRLSAGYRAQELNAPLADRFELTAYGQDNERQLLFGVGPFGIGPGRTMEIESLNETDIRSYGVRAEARKLVSSGLLLTYGVDLWRDRAIGTDESTTTITGFGPAPIEQVENRPQLPEAAYLSAGLFAQGEIEASDRLSFVAGARWQHVSAETFETEGLDDQTPIEITDGTLVGAFNALFRATEELTFVGSVGRAFRSPNLIERFFDGATPEGFGYQVRNPDLGPETSLNVDVGVRFRRGPVGLEAFGFRNEISDGIRIEALGSEVDGMPAFRNTNVDELVFRGIELSGDAQLGGGLSASSALTWMDAENKLDVENPVGESFATKWTAALRYDESGERFWLSGDVRHNGEQLEVDFGGDNPVGATMPSFTVLNARGGVTVWRSDSGVTHRLNVALTNLTNTLYAEFSNVGFFRPEPKRNLTLAWHVSF